jgi:hypothetical protein
MTAYAYLCDTQNSSTASATLHPGTWPCPCSCEQEDTLDTASNKTWEASHPFRETPEIRKVFILTPGHAHEFHISVWAQEIITVLMF